PQAAQGQVPAPAGPAVTHRRPAEADRSPPAEEYGHDPTGAGHPDPLSGTVDAPIGRHPSSDWTWAVTREGKPSVTHYDLIEAYARGIKVDTTRMEELDGQLDPSNPEALQEALAGGLLQPEDTP
ncbi:zinc-dependent metalloprotease, partial [Streptomyces sp. BE303]|uniref:zinc-dependent metalloprotease n=1 Tax=Streptomyces sp. BE303 TaxID=3002528 RepID=UPI002E9BC3DC|nr:hypothetical protein [Streptomyces sp. BE303]